MVLTHADGERPDPSWSEIAIARTQDGRFYTGTVSDITVIRWDAMGRYVSYFGRAGEGPGEFAKRGQLMLLLDVTDSLIVIDGARRATWVDSTGNYVRMISNLPVTRTRGSLHALPGGLLLSTSPLPDTKSHWFHVTSADGRVIRAFGPVGERDSADNHVLQRRSAVVPDGTSFWVLPQRGSQEFTIEQWSTSGQLLRVLHRQAEWYQSAMNAGAPYPEFTNVRVDARGLIWLTAVVKDSRWRPTDSFEEDEALLDTQYDLRYEVIDPASVRLVAHGMLDTLRYSPLFKFVRGSTLTYRPVIDSLGLASIEFFDLRLVQQSR